MLNLPTAGLGSRFVARGIDVLIQGALILILLTATSVIGTGLSGVEAPLNGRWWCSWFS